MRRKVGLVLLALGVFLIVIAPLARYYAYPKLAVAPIDEDTVSTLVGPNANIFDVATLKNVTTDLTTKARTVGDIAASKAAPGNTRVWVNTSSTKDSNGTIQSRIIERVAFDARTGEAVNCCGEYYETVAGDQTPVKRAGLLYKFPFETQKKTYTFWDDTLAKALPVKYTGTAEVDGVHTYKFVQTIKPTVTSTTAVPASVLKLNQSGNVQAQQVYSNVRTLYVEPRTGVILKRAEHQFSTIAYQGENRLVTTDVVTGYDASTVKDNADTYGQFGLLLYFLKDLGPLLALIFGVILVLIGAVLTRAAGPTERVAHEPKRVARKAKRA
jgi:Porin PorA